MSVVSMEDFSGLAERETAMADIRQRLADLESRVSRSPDSNRLSLVVFSGQRDRLLAALTMAVGAAACGMEVNLFFTFWATAGAQTGAAAVARQTLDRTLLRLVSAWRLPAPAAVASRLLWIRRGCSRVKCIARGSLMFQSCWEYWRTSKCPCTSARCPCH